jgi:hypothetical protein
VKIATPLATGAYRWRVSGRTLSLMPLADGCLDRRTILAGAWTHT